MIWLKTDDPTRACPPRTRLVRLVPVAMSMGAVAIFVLSVLVDDPANQEDAGTMMTLLLLAMMTVCMLPVVIRRGPRLPGQAAIGGGLVVGVTVGAVAIDPANAIGGILMGLPAGLGWYAAARLFECSPELLSRWGSPRTQVRNLARWGVTAGLVLGIVNLFEPLLAGEQLLWGGLPRTLLMGLQPGIFEEVVFHVFPFALWVATRGLPRTRWESVAMYSFLILPHSAMHVPDMVLTDPGGAIIQIVYPALIFGIPLIVLLSRYGGGAAMAAHGLVDSVRFTAGWLP